MEGGRHHGESALERLARQIGKAAAIGKARGMDDGVDRAEGGAGGADEFGGRPGLGKIAGREGNLGAGALAFGSNRLQPRIGSFISALTVQCQAPWRPASRRATAAPMPDPPPVMMVTRMSCTSSPLRCEL